LIRMGELAVPALASESAGENAIQCILALREIGTPSAAEAIVPHLGDTKDDVALAAAWSLGNLLQSKSIEEAFGFFGKIPIVLDHETLDWVWEPFEESKSSFLRQMCGRIAFILNNARSIPDYLQAYELDPRFSIPLCIDNLSDKAYGDILLLRYSELRSIYHRKIELRPLGELTERELKEKREIETQAKQKVNEALERLSREEDTSKYLKSMGKGLQLDFITRILSGRKPTQSDWSNVLRKEVYTFGRSWHYYVILVIAGVLSIISIGYMGLNIYHSQTLLSYWNVFLCFLIFTILYTWSIFLSSSLLLDFDNPGDFLVLFIGGVVVVPVAIFEFHDAEDFGLLPFMTWAPAIGYFTTTFLLIFVSWLVAALIWVIIIGGCISLAVIGSRKDKRSRNPLKGILDVAERTP
ncbi:MAG: HEAT repeat domain-containing protein, partial [Proteobacteria bacterium]|nr:HEAT repeat domain-containing protein [Pseudomonadota bacterium]